MTRKDDQSGDDDFGAAVGAVSDGGVIRFPNGDPVLAFATIDEAQAQADALGGHHVEAVGTAIAVVADPV